VHRLGRALAMLWRCYVDIDRIHTGVSRRLSLLPPPAAAHVLTSPRAPVWQMSAGYRPPPSIRSVGSASAPADGPGRSAACRTCTRRVRACWAATVGGLAFAMVFGIAAPPHQGPLMHAEGWQRRAFEVLASQNFDMHGVHRGSRTTRLAGRVLCVFPDLMLVQRRKPSVLRSE